MNSHATFLAALTIIFCATISSAQWTPDPFCPYPSDEVTRYPYYGNCSVFWECFEGTKYVMECPEGLEFNAPLQQCDTPSIANCDPNAPTTGNPQPPTTNSNGPGPSCPYPSEELIFFPYEGDCTKYWECFEGNHYLYNCPDGLWWHQEISQCDFPGDFCNNQTTGPTQAPTRPTIVPPECPNPLPDDPVYFPYEGDCTKYWECSANGLVVETCPDGLWWYQSLRQCDYPNGDDCNNGPGPTIGPTEAPPECPNPLPDEPVYFPYEGDCTKYWECSTTGLLVLTCPDGLWWYQSLRQCDYPNGDDCNSGPGPTIGPTEAPPECPNPLPDEPVYFPYEGDCTKYWECSTTGLLVLTCPDGLWWYQSLGRCDYPSDGGCNNGTYPTPPTVIPTEPPPECPNPLPDNPVYFPYATDCTKYWECSTQGLLLLTCPDGLWWHHAISQCDFPGEGVCYNGTGPVPSTVPPPVCPDPLPEEPVYFPNSGDCTMYWECSENGLVAVSCPDGLWWDQAAEQCDYPSSETCNVYAKPWYRVFDWF